MLTPIKGYPQYSINPQGDIFNHNGVRLKWIYRTGRKPYPRVALHLNNHPKWFAVHRLVAIHFLPNPQHLKLVHHKDNDPQNPEVSNLEWISNRDNINKAYQDGLIDLNLKSLSAKHFGDNPRAVPVIITHKQTGETHEFDCIKRLRVFFKKNSATSIQQAIREPHRTVNGYYVRKILKNNG